MEVVGKSLLVWRVPILSDQEESATPVRLSHQRYLAWTALQRLDLLDTNILVDNPSLRQAGEELYHEWQLATGHSFPPPDGHNSWWDAAGPLAEHVQ